MFDDQPLIGAEEKRHSVEALRAEMIERLSYYEHSAAAFAVLLLQKGSWTPTGLAEKMKEVEARRQRLTSNPMGSPGRTIDPLEGASNRARR